MKRLKLLLSFSIVLLSLSISVSAEAKDNKNQVQLDSMATRLAERLDTCAWRLIPDRFTGSNNVRIELKDVQDNDVSVFANIISINLNFVGARTSAMASSPHQKGRALVGAAAAVQINGYLPDHINVKGRIEQKKVTIGKKSKTVSVEIRYIIEDSNINQLSSTAKVILTVNTANMSSHLVFYNMNLDGNMEGRIKMF